MAYLINLTKVSSWPICFTAIIYISLIWIQGFNSALYQVFSEFEIALTMALGSFVAGGTALGGGAVAFPVMTKVLHIEPQAAKVFSLAIQSFGMTAAALTIVCRSIPIYTNVILMALPMSAVGVTLSLLFISPLISGLIVKTIFSFLLLCFAITLILKLRRNAQRLTCNLAITPPRSHIMYIALFGGIASGLVGSGSDIVLFAYLVIICNADIKRSTATSVIVMAFTSALGSTLNAWYLGIIDNQIQEYLLAAIPVVVIGAPLGAFVCSKVNANQLVSFLLLLIALEISSTSYHLYVQL